MTGRYSWLNRMAAIGMALTLAAALPSLADAQLAKPRKKKEDIAAAQDEGPKTEYSKEFRKVATRAQGFANEKKWAELLAVLPELEALPNPTRDEKKAIATWRLQATQGSGDQEGFAAAIEVFLKEGYTEPGQIGAMHRQLAAHYSAKQDREKTVYHFRQFVDATPDVEPDELETLGRLYLQVNNYADATLFLGKAIDLSTSRKETPKEMWFQLRDRCYIEQKDDAGRLANLEALVGYYPNREYYSRIVAIYQNQSKDDRVVMLNAYRMAVSDPLGGLATVGGYLNYVDTALVAGSPGEAARALERGMKDGIVPSAGTNQQTLQEARAAVAQDRRSLPAESAAAEKNAKGELDVKVGLGFYSTGDYEQAATAARRGIAKGGVARIDDANLLLGASLVELGRRDEARAAFEAARAAAPAGGHMARIAGLWLARLMRAEPAPAGG
jgi:tetratricopeptide (TPR) repeat protein